MCQLFSAPRLTVDFAQKSHFSLKTKRRPGSLRESMKYKIPPVLAALAALVTLCSCASTNPDARDMDRYYKEAQARADRKISQYAELRNEGKISEEVYNEKVKEVNAEVGRQAMELAWNRHEMQEAQMRMLGEPTGDHPVYMKAPTVGDSDTFYRAAGDAGGQGYQGMGSGMWHGYQPGTMATAFQGLNSMAPSGP
jgi:hypothetical protein